MSAAVFEPARKLLEGYFQAAWTYPEPVRYENVPFAQPLNRAWLGFYVRWGIGQQANIGPIGRRIERHSGVVMVQVFSPVKQGQKPLMVLCDQVGAIMRMNQLRDGDVEIELRATELHDMGEEKDLLHKNVVIPFQVDANF